MFGMFYGKGIEVDMNTDQPIMTKAQLARTLNVSRTFVTLLTQGKRKPSKEMADRLAKLGLTANLSALTNTCAGTQTGPLAQLAEHLTFNQGVAGSRPARPTS